MKVVFVGPSCPRAQELAGSEIVIRPPATQGDVQAAVDAGATAIGLIDGGFEYTAPVFHKEILRGLAKGVTIVGAASMGALRAAECEAFGMVGIGEIFEGYRSGRLVDDSDVALLHGPEELDYIPLTIPMVNVDATLSFCVARSLMTRDEAFVVDRAARTMFFKHRTWKTVAKACGELDPARSVEILQILKKYQIDQKRDDAVLLLREILTIGSVREMRPWTLKQTSFSRK